MKTNYAGCTSNMLRCVCAMRESTWAEPKVKPGPSDCAPAFSKSVNLRLTHTGPKFGNAGRIIFCAGPLTTLLESKHWNPLAALKSRMCVHRGSEGNQQQRGTCGAASSFMAHVSANGWKLRNITQHTRKIHKEINCLEWRLNNGMQ